MVRTNVISFSGGRTSAYMLKYLCDEGIAQGAITVFADTGKEAKETYDFVKKCGEEFGVDIINVFRDGKFDKLITDRRIVPNVVSRFCTTELKVRPIQKYLRSLGISDKNVNMYIGLRADEAHRYHRLKSNKISWAYKVPLIDLGVTVETVNDFWKLQNFDLQIPSYVGNCVGCFLKKKSKLIRLFSERPSEMQWYISQEKRTGTQFNKDISYSGLRFIAENQKKLFADDNDDYAYNCFCGQ